MSYTWSGMDKVDLDTALDLFDEEKEVFLLYDDNTEALAECLADIMQHAEHGGEFGYSYADRVLWKSQNKKWYIKTVLQSTTNKIRVIVSNGWEVQYPILYDGGQQVVYDYPERIPQYVHEQVVKKMVKLRDDGILGKYIDPETKTFDADKAYF